MDTYYTSRYTFDPIRQVVWKEIVRYLQKFIPTGATVIDLGSGYADFINQVSASKKYAVDISSEAAKYVESDVEFYQSPVWDLQAIKSGSVDVIHASNLLEHLSDDELEKTLTELKRVLKTGGRLILIQPNYRLVAKHYFDDPTHKKVFSDASLESFLLGQGFKIIRQEPRFLPFSMKSRSRFLPVSSWLVRLYLSLPWRPLAGQMLFIAENTNKATEL